MRRTTVLIGVAVLSGVATFGCGGDETALPVVSTQSPSTTEGPLFTRNAGETIAPTEPTPATSPSESESVPTEPQRAGGSTTTDAVLVRTTDSASTTDTAPGTSADGSGSDTTTASATITPTSIDDDTDTDTDTDTGDAGQDAVDVGVLAMKNFIVRMLGEGIRLVYDDIDLDDTELACIGRAEAAGLPVDEFDDVLFDCLDDDSFDTVIQAGSRAGDGDP